MIRKSIRGNIKNNPSLEVLLPLIKGNIGFVFIDKSVDVSSIQSIIGNKQVSAPAKVGSIAPCDVVVPAGPTGLEPTRTAYFASLNIATKISRGQIEIIQDCPLIKKGEKVGVYQADLLSNLGIKPFA